MIIVIVGLGVKDGHAERKRDRVAGSSMIAVVAFDFATKTEVAIPPSGVVQACADGRFCWVDIDVAQEADAARSVLSGLGVAPHVVQAVLDQDAGERYDIHEDCLHLRVFAARFADDRFAALPVDLILGEQFLVTVHRGEVEFLNQVRRTYRQDFLRFARGPGFLLYECWDHMIDGYRTADRGLSGHVRSIQEQLFGEADDAIFTRVAEATRNLLGFRQVVLASREVLNELCTRRSAFVAETTQPYLEKMVGTLGRLDTDLSVEREILSETLHLYMGIVSHRTGKVLNRLTVVSLVFLPLSFLCGVYGMNFEVIPELRWRYGYIFFWGLALTLVGGMLAYMRRHKLW
jgi:magnesium transporter